MICSFIIADPGFREGPSPLVKPKDTEERQPIRWQNSSSVITNKRSMNELRRSRIRNPHSLSQNTVDNSVGAVRTLEHWIWQRPQWKERRCVNDIPPEELDKYLVEFFSSLTHYKTYSFSVLRSNLKRYLEITGYPACIKSSPVFENSRRACSEMLRKFNMVKEGEFH